MDPEALDRRRFCITINSVHYYLDAGPSDANRVCCAVLLTTTFILKAGEQIAFANVPLATQALRDAGSTSENAKEGNINISSHFPAGEEYVKVGHWTGIRDIHATPVVRADFGIGGVEIGGMGVDRRQSDDKRYMISLQRVLVVLDEQPTSLSWKFEGSQGVYYPWSTKLLVVVQKLSENNELWFPFELRLQWKFKVEVHGDGLGQSIKRLLARVDKHDGWMFKICGNYEAGVAKDAMEDAKMAAQHEKIPKMVGLRAAVMPWKNAQVTDVLS
ncbi:hypothetical protein BDQ12DRAFT_744305 [Crucibulum laeve]|uniref:Uncharacterized protein n=1 Tax=Crucibulum laeve TaxID=68775 RepID=A0A5C3LGM8_9AGAR|nr:hypothetical protein BDQ12DRAFT_744305 [Crucibulum laeve]